MNTTIKLKRISAIVLLLAFFMPLSQCSSIQTEGSAEPPKTTIFYAYSHDNKISTIMLLSVIAFLWPSLSILLVAYRKTLNSSLIFKLSELLFCIGTAYILVGLTLFGDLLYGSYVAGLSILTYALITLYESFLIIRDKYNKRV